jgi:hypothetical protein
MDFAMPYMCQILREYITKVSDEGNDGDSHGIITFPD